MLSIGGGQFDFFTDKHEGMIGVDPSKIVIWVDEKGFSVSPGEGEPKNYGEFKTIDDLFSGFMVDGLPFVDAVLPDIPKLIQLYT